MSNTYDIGIIGGGLAGLCLSIQAVKKGYKVLLIEKETYPFHKVCGEYISLESWHFLERIGLPLSQMQLPIIKQLKISSPNGNYLQQALPQGGFGISRYKLDNLLKNIAIENGVTIIENCKAEDIIFEQDKFTISTSKQLFICKVCCGSFGKRSNIDVKWKRKFILEKNNRLNNYIGVKYHIKSNAPLNEIVLHNFKDGYCGMSKIEDDLYCLCYLTTAKNLNQNNNSIELMEQNILQQNPFLASIFTTAQKVYEKPLTISQISFSQKKQIENHVLFIGDAAGMITPLCGNGMSMAMHGSKIVFEKIDLFLSNKISRVQMEIDYTKDWQNQFKRRLLVGRLIQTMFGHKWLTNILIGFLKNNKWLTTQLVKLTHGKPF